jgi:hypothetical protein
MPHSASAIRPEIVDLIKTTIRETMAPFGFEDASARAGEDHDGDPVIFVDVEYDMKDPPMGPSTTFELLTRVRDRLLDAGETRFPHIRHNYQDHRPLKARRRAPA